MSADHHNLIDKIATWNLCQDVVVKGIIVEQLGVDEEEVTPDASFVDDLGADSLDVVELVMTLEDAFDIEVPDDAVEEMRTIGDVQRFVEARV